RHVEEAARALAAAFESDRAAESVVAERGHDAVGADAQTEGEVILEVDGADHRGDQHLATGLVEVLDHLLDRKLEDRRREADDRRLGRTAFELTARAPREGDLALLGAGAARAAGPRCPGTGAALDDRRGADVTPGEAGRLVIDSDVAAGLREDRVELLRDLDR